MAAAVMGPAPGRQRSHVLGGICGIGSRSVKWRPKGGKKGAPARGEGRETSHTDLEMQTQIDWLLERV